MVKSDFPKWVVLTKRVSSLNSSFLVKRPWTNESHSNRPTITMSTYFDLHFIRRYVDLLLFHAILNLVKGEPYYNKAISYNWNIVSCAHIIIWININSCLIPCSFNIRRNVQVYCVRYTNLIVVISSRYIGISYCSR